MWNIYIELASIIIALITLIYLIGNIKLLDHGVSKGFKFAALAFILFVLGKIGRILDYSGIMDTKCYGGICGLLFIIVVLIAVVKINKDLKGIVFHKSHKRRRKRK